MTQKILSVAHRGYSAIWPENTVAGALAAIAAGADLVEADVRLTSDGVLLCSHDADLGRLTGQSLAVAAHPLAALAALPRLDGGELTRFDSILAAVSGRSGLLVDTKLTGDAVLDALAHSLGEAGWPAQVWLGLRSAALVRRARAVFGTRVAILGFIPDIADADAFLESGADALRLWEADLARPEAAVLRGKAPVWVTSGNCNGHAVGDTDAAGLAAIRAFGPAAVLLNDPALLHAGTGGTAR